MDAERNMLPCIIKLFVILYDFHFQFMGKILIKLNHTKTIGIKKSIVSIVLMT